MSTSILSFGTATPPHAMSQAEAVELAANIVCQTPQHERLVKALYRKAGVEQRFTAVPHELAYRWAPEASHGRRAGDDSDGPTTHETTTHGPTTRERMAMYAEHAGLLAATAAGRALQSCPVSAADISHLVTVSCTGFGAPGVDIELINRLGLAPDTQRVHVGFMGCHGAINGLRTAQAIAASRPAARVLLCAVELCSLHYRFCWDPERIVANALFADGSAAVVMKDGDEHDGAACRVVDTGSFLIPHSTDAMTWDVGDHGFEMTLSARVPDLIGNYLRPWLERWLAERGWSVESMGSWAIHPGGPRILHAVEQSLGLPRSATQHSRQILRDHGNMSSPTLLFIVRQMLDAGCPRPYLALGFGPGLVAEVALLT